MDWIGRAGRREFFDHSHPPRSGPDFGLFGPSTCNGRPFQGNCGEAARAAARQRGGTMLVNLHLWEAPVRNLDWVTSAFGYR